MSNSYNSDQNFICHIKRFIGETVTIFTTSGGASGCGFTGIILAVNCDFVRISTLQGTPPANPLSTTICGGYNNDGYGNTCENDYGQNDKNGYFNVGSVCDIPIDKIAAFCHNAV